MEYLKFYIFYISLFTVITIFVLKYLNNKTNEQRLTFLKIVAAVGILLHVIKPFFFPYNGNIDVSIGSGNPDIFKFPAILRKITIENVSAATTVLYLPILISNRKFLLDYITIIGFLGGFLAIIFPAEVIFETFDSMHVSYSKNLFSFDTIRFYFVHYIPLLLSFSLLYYGIHKLDLKRKYFFGIAVLIILSVLFLNELFIYKIGWLDDIERIMREEHGITNLFYDRNYRNFSFVFGLSDTFKKAGFWIDMLVPSFMKNFQGDNYIPVVWITIPALVYGPLIYMGFYYSFGKLSLLRNERDLKNEKLESA